MMLDLLGGFGEKGRTSLAVSSGDDRILLDIGINDMILLTDTPEKKVVALDGYGLNIVGTHPIRGLRKATATRQ